MTPATSQQAACGGQGHRARPGGSRRLVRNLVLLLTPLLVLLPGCKSLLPTGATHTPLPWSSYADALAAIDRIDPYKSTRAELRGQGIDPAVNPSITILNYTDLLQRLGAVAAVQPERLERGIADCLQAAKRCTAYSIDVRQVKTKRVGNFWLDILDFKHDTITTGWSFNALVIFIDDLAVFALGGGQPNINSEEVTRNPLGPLQGIGQSVRPSVP